MSGLGGIWVARALGPEKLGISTFVFGMVNLLTLLASLNQDNNYVRRGFNLPPGETLGSLVGQVYSLRLGMAMLLVAAALTSLAFIRPDSVWFLAIAVGVVLVLMQSNDAGWILKLRDRMPMFFVAISIQGMITGGLYILFIRPDWPAGSDLALACVGSAAGLLLAWWWACRGVESIKVSPANFLGGCRLLREGSWLVVMGIGMYLLTSAEIPLIGLLASVEDLGIYRSALQLINVINPFVPLFFFRLYPKLIELQRDSPLLVLGEQLKSFGLVISVGGPLIIAAFLGAPLIFPIIYKQAFAPAALPFAILFTGKVLSVGVNVFMWGGFARHLDKQIVLLTLGVSLLSLGANFILIPKIGIMGAALVSASSQAALLVGSIGVMIRSDGKLKRTLDPGYFT